MAARLLGALFFLACLPAFCQTDDLAIGRLLVASRDLGDPNFAKTVILLVHYNEDQGAVGLVVNKRTDVPISRVFHDLKEAERPQRPGVHRRPRGVEQRTGAAEIGQQAGGRA